ncbi:MAG: hypothetical protein ABI824_19270 [Acidobacteriota bacterium]
MKDSAVLLLRVLLAASLFAGLAWGQSDSITYQRDINGRMSPTAEVRTTADGHSEKTIIINGRPMPLEQSDEKLVRQDASGKVVERTVRTYGPTGQLIGTDRFVIEEMGKPGASSVKQTTYRLDINGHSQEVERRVTETRTQGQSTNVETIVQQPGLSGSFTTTERRNKVTSGTPDNLQTTESVYLPAGPGGLHETERVISTTAVKGSQTTSNTAKYEFSTTGSGSMQMREQTVTVGTRQPNGSEVVETSVYGPIMGKAESSSSQPSLREAQRTDRQVAADGSVTERTTVRRADLSNIGRLGAEQNLSETICKGKCLPEKDTDTKSKAAAIKLADSKATDPKSATAKSADSKAAPAPASTTKP